MRAEASAEPADVIVIRRKPPRTWLEVVLAALGFAAWLWCAFEVMRPI